jgi:hypothetical protein
VAYVVYDPRNGDIVHIHHVLTLGADPGPSGGEAEAEAIALARQLGHQVDDLRALAVPPDGPDPGIARRVDVRRLRLVTDEPESA